MKHPPHLPPKSCSLPARNHWHALKWALSVVALAFITSVAASLITFSWLLPLLYPGDGLYLINRAGDQNELVQDPRLIRHIRERTFTVYNRSVFSNKNVFPRHAQLGQAVVLSSDGWVMLPLDVVDGFERAALVALDHQGTRRDAEFILTDQQHNMAYIKFPGPDARVASFADWPAVSAGAQTWLVNGVWKSAHVQEYAAQESQPFRIDRFNDAYRLAETAAAGALAITEKGDIIGFIHEDGLLYPAWSAEFHLPSILELETLKPFALDLRGYFIDGWIDPQTEIWKTQTGFYVSNTGTHDSELKQGDIIIALNNEEISPNDFVRRMFLAGDPLVMTVIRAGAERELTIDK